MLIKNIILIVSTILLLFIIYKLGEQLLNFIQDMYKNRVH